MFISSANGILLQPCHNSHAPATTLSVMKFCVTSANPFSITMHGGFRKTADGFEQTWAVNVLAPFVLTACLSSRIRDRVINVSSISASSSIDWNNLQQEKGFSSHNAYSLSKLAIQMLTANMAKQLDPHGVTVSCLDPGTVNTKMLLAGWGKIGVEVCAQDSVCVLVVLLSMQI